MTSKPAPDLVVTLVLAGFDGIYVDRHGYPDSGEKLEVDLTGIIGKGPIVSENGRLAFFDLTEYERRTREQTPAQEWEARGDAALNPLLPVWQSGCSDVEGTAENNWRWCGSEGRLYLVNNSRQTKHATLEMSFATGEPAKLQLSSVFFEEELSTDATLLPLPDRSPFRPDAIKSSSILMRAKSFHPRVLRELFFGVRNSESMSHRRRKLPRGCKVSI